MQLSHYIKCDKHKRSLAIRLSFGCQLPPEQERL